MVSSLAGIMGHRSLGVMEETQHILDSLTNHLPLCQMPPSYGIMWPYHMCTLKPQMMVSWLPFLGISRSKDHLLSVRWRRGRKEGQRARWTETSTSGSE